MGMPTPTSARSSLGSKTYLTEQRWALPGGGLLANTKPPEDLAEQRLVRKLACQALRAEVGQPEGLRHQLQRPAWSVKVAVRITHVLSTVAQRPQVALPRREYTRVLSLRAGHAQYRLAQKV